MHRHGACTLRTLMKKTEPVNLPSSLAEAQEEIRRLRAETKRLTWPWKTSLPWPLAQRTRSLVRSSCIGGQLPHSPVRIGCSPLPQTAGVRYRVGRWGGLRDARISG